MYSSSVIYNVSHVIIQNTVILPTEVEPTRKNGKIQKVVFYRVKDLIRKPKLGKLSFHLVITSFQDDIFLHYCCRFNQTSKLDKITT